MTLTRRTLLKRVSIGALALALGKLPPGAPEVVRLEAVDGVPGLASAAAKMPAWLPLDGRMLKAHEYPELHAALRETYFGLPTSSADADVEFQIPDLRGRAWLGESWETPAGSNPNVMPMMRADGQNLGDVHWRVEE